MTTMPTTPLITACLSLALAALVAASATAQAPIIGPGECLHLVGAPPGAPAAETEERVEGSHVEPSCNLIAGSAVDRDGPNMVQAWVRNDAVNPDRAHCLLEAWTGHSFTFDPAAEGPARAWITMSGSLAGALTNFLTFAGNGSGLRLGLRLVEDPSGSRSVVAERVLMDRRHFPVTLVEPTRQYGARLAADFLPGREYALEAWIELEGIEGVRALDFGESPGGGFLQYDVIEVCTAAVATSTAGAADALERDLYERRCMPATWLPEAAGGRLEEARDLVALRLAQAAATGAPGVNERVAEQRLEQADAHIGDGDFQAACRSLSLGLRALTTP